MERDRDIGKWIKGNYNSENLIIRYMMRSLYFIKKSAYTVKKIITDKEFRAIFGMVVFRGKSSSNNFPNMYG